MSPSRSQTVFKAHLWAWEKADHSSLHNETWNTFRQLDVKLKIAKTWNFVCLTNWLWSQAVTINLLCHNNKLAGGMWALCVSSVSYIYNFLYQHAAWQQRNLRCHTTDTVIELYNSHMGCEHVHRFWSEADFTYCVTMLMKSPVILKETFWWHIHLLYNVYKLELWLTALSARLPVHIH